MNKQDLQNKIKELTLSGDKVKLSYYKMIYSEAQRKENDLNNPVVMDEKSISQTVKKLYDSAVETLRYTDRADVKAEVEFYGSLLPKTLSEIETKNVINDILDKLQTQGIQSIKKNKGLVMKEVKNVTNIDMKLAGSLIDAILV